MAQVQDAVAITIAKKSVDAATKFMQALEDLEALYAWASDAGINFNNFVDQIEANGDVQHTDSTNLNRLLLNVAAGVRTYIDTTNVSGTYYDEILQTNRNDL